LKTLLHIGYPKTASTWFQRYFYPNIENICYMDRYIIQQKLLTPGPFEFYRDNVKKFFQSYDNKRIAICEELLIGRLRAGGLKGFMTKEIGHRLYDIFPDADIVIFIRNQIDIIASSYMQYVKAGGNYSVDRFLFHKGFKHKDYHDLVLLNFAYFEYDKVVEFYSNLFNKDNVHVYLYEDFLHNNKMFLKDYINKFKLKIDIDDIDYNIANRGYRKGLMPMKRVLNAFTRHGPLFKYYIIHIPNFHLISKRLINYANRYRIFGEKSRPLDILGKANVSFIREYYKQSNRELINKFGLSNINKYNYPL
jgi:hypothetical protein